MLSPDELKAWVGIVVQVVNAAATVGVWLYVRYGDRNKEVDQRIAALQAAMDQRADGHDTRIAQVEGQLKGAPTHQDLAKLYERMNAIAQSTNTMSGQVQLMNQNMAALMNHIVQKGLSS